MKKQFIYALFGAIALTGAVMFTSCTDSEELDVNPNYDPETNSVVVDVALNISTANTPQTRMSSSATQATTTDAFRGISDAKLFAIAQTDNGKHLATATTAAKRYDLAQLVSSTQISSSNSRRVLEMSLPLKTNTLVFYGRATKPTSGDATGLTADDSYGSLISQTINNSTSDLSDLQFTVGQRLTSDKLDEYRKVEKLLAGILSCIMNTNLSKVTANVTADAVAGDHEYGFALAVDEIKSIKWSDYTKSNGESPFTAGVERYTLEEQLSKAYLQMTTIRGNNGELRAASGEALIQTVTDLWSAVNKVRCALPLCKEEAVAKKLASEIDDEIAKYFKATSKPSDGAAVSGVTFGENLSTIITNFISDPFWPVNEALAANVDYKRANYGLTSPGFSPNLKEFPVSYGLPRGATHVKFGVGADEDGDIELPIFYYPTNFNTSAVGDVAFTVQDYLYSPELTYFGNSPVRVSNTQHQTNEYPNGANTNAPVADDPATPSVNEEKVGGWNNDASWSTDWNSNYVTAASRSVAMKYDINYGTALLKTTVKLGSTSLRDNNHEVQKSFNDAISNDKVGGDGDNKDEYKDEPDNTLTVNDTSFELIGVIVGGQTRHVGWDFLPKKVGESGSEAYQYGFVTDNAIPKAAKAVTSSGSGPNYTLLFDNYKAGTYTDEFAEQSAQEKVFVALEFKNNSGYDFYGNYNLIRKGGTFYLIGQLNPNATGLVKPTWPTNHKLPPYNADGTSREITRVFMQDYMTTANFTIGPHSLKYAYLTVPDLRSSSLTLGLSVDIKWETGLVFDNIILGGNDY